jgi:hypothetical protein
VLADCLRCMKGSRFAVTDSATIAVLGAGMQGTAVALELARRGCSVDLFDRAARPITAAGLQNEGKLHLGFVYGNDPSMRTTRRIAAGSLRFVPLLRRWVGAAVERIPLATPILYAVPSDSMLSPEEVREHFSRVEQAVWQLAKQNGANGAEIGYPGLGDDGAIFRPLPDAVRDRYFSPDTTTAAFETSEIAVDPVSIGTIIRRAVEASSRIRFVPNAHVQSVERRGDGYRVATSPVENSSDRRYDHVVNALWDGRLHIDREMELLPNKAWLWRYKAGLRLTPRVDVPELASVTFMLGPYGDIVQYQDGSVYVCWYPAGLLGCSSDLTPPNHWNASGSRLREELVSATFDGLARLYPDIDLVRPIARTAVEIMGGVIFAWGATDIDDPDSELHRRDDIGVTSSGGYHSVNTGKYCMAPLLAIEVANAIAPDAPGSLL